MMAADYRHIGGLENRLGRHYSRFWAVWPAPALAGQSLALRKLCDAGSNRRSRVRPEACIEAQLDLAKQAGAERELGTIVKQLHQELAGVPVETQGQFPRQTGR